MVSVNVPVIRLFPLFPNPLNLHSKEECCLGERLYCQRGSAQMLAEISNTIPGEGGTLQDIIVHCRDFLKICIDILPSVSTMSMFILICKAVLSK